MSTMKGSIVRGDRSPEIGTGHNHRVPCVRCGRPRMVKAKGHNELCFDCKLVDPDFGKAKRQ